MRQLMLIPTMALALAAPAVAKTITVPITVGNPVIPSTGCMQPYTVKQGDNLWALSDWRLHNPRLWSWLVQQNPMLQEPGRQYNKNGTTYVMIRPGEMLYCLEEAGITLSTTPDVTSNVASTLDGKDQGSNSVTAKWTLGDEIASFLEGNWGWLLLLLGTGLLVWFLRELDKDPVRSGPPQVTGGVSDDTIRDQLQRRGSQQNFTLIPGSITRGRGYGRMMVSYHGGAEHLRVLSGETIYRARALRHDGQEVDVYTLQGCGNDVNQLQRFRLFNNFRFVGDETVAEPAPEPVAEEVVAPQSTTSEPPADFKGELAPGTIHGSVQGPRTPGDTATLRIRGASLNGLTFTLSKDDLTVRWVPDEAE